MDAASCGHSLGVRLHSGRCVEDTKKTYALVIEGSACAGKKPQEMAWAKIQSTKPHPEIFWEFIKNDRDLILKEYQWRIRQNVTVGAGTHITRKIGAGPREGLDQKLVYQEAIDFWDGYLSEIELAVKVLKS